MQASASVEFQDVTAHDARLPLAPAGNRASSIPAQVDRPAMAGVPV
jgi:hypothetical protein